MLKCFTKGKHLAAFFAWFLAIGQNSYSQILINQNSVTIQVNNTTLSVNGGIANQGVITNNGGTIIVSGDWTNQNQFNPGNGTVILNGTSPQNISHSGNQFYNLDLQGSGEKILLTDAEVTNILNFNSALLTTQGASAIIIRQAGRVTNPSSSAYVNGLLFQEGNGQKFYPIGTKGNYVPVTLENVSGTNPLIGLQAFEPNSGALPGPELISVSANRYWQLFERGGPTFAGSPITLTLASDEDTSTPSMAVVAEADAPTGPYRNLGQATLNLNNPNTITSSATVTGKFFALGNVRIDEATILVPDALSPMALDAKDNSIRIYGNTSTLSPSNFEFTVFSRWGNVLFQSTSLIEMIATGWTGIDSGTGTLVSSGSYTYSIKAKFNNGKSFEKTGTINMIK